MYKPYGIIPPIITPFNGDGSVNYQSLGQMSKFLLDSGVHGLFPFGTTGEFYAVNDEEFVKALETVRDAAKGRKDRYSNPVQLLAGCSHITTRGVIRLAKLVEQVGGYDAISVLTPMFVSQTQDELYTYYRTIAESTSLPVIMYNNKPKTNVTIAPATVAKLAKDCPNIKEYFADYFLHTSDVTYDFTKGKNDMTVHRNTSEPWKVTVVDTGLNTMTGGRVRRVKEYIGSEPFMLTYGDGVSDLNIPELLNFHQSHGKMVTMSAYNAGQRFGVLDIDSRGQIRDFREKTQGDGSLVNIGFMVCQPEFIDCIGGDSTVLEKEPLDTVAKLGQLMAYKHTGFWKCMDTVREKEQLESMWANGQAPWKVW